MEFVAVIGSRGSGKSTLISAFLGQSLHMSSGNPEVSIWKTGDLALIELDIDVALLYSDLLGRCSLQIFVFDPFNPNPNVIDQFVEIVSSNSRSIPSLLVINKIDAATRKPHNKLLDKILQTHRVLKNKGEDIELMEVSSLYRSQIESIRKWINVRKHSYSIKIEDLDVILFKLGLEGPQEIYSNLPTTVFTKDLSKEEFIQNFIINASVQLTQGEVYPNGIFIIPGGHSQGTRALTFTWRMQDLDKDRDHRLEQGLFFLSVLCPITSPLLSYPHSLLEARFLSNSSITYEMVDNPVAYLHVFLPKIFPELF